MQRTFLRNRELGILGLSSSLRQDKKYLFFCLRTKLRCLSSRLRAHRDFYVDITVNLGSGPLSKIFAVYGISSGVGVTDSPHRQLSRLPAHIGPSNPLRNPKVFVLQPFMDPVHDLFPDSFMVGSGSLYGLAVVVAAPDSGCVVRRIAYKPQIPAVGGGPALPSGCHGIKSRPPPCRAYGDDREFALPSHGIFHGICQEKRGLRL